MLGREERETLQWEKKKLQNQNPWQSMKNSDIKYNRNNVTY